MDRLATSLNKIKIILMVLCAYFFVAWVEHIYSGLLDDIDYYFATYFIVIFSFFFGFTLFKFYKKDFVLNWKVDFWDFVIGTSLTLLYVGTRYVKYPEMGIWLDEYTQYLYGNQISRNSAVTLSFFEQQPPLDYVLSGVAGKIIGLKVFAVKFHSLLFCYLFLMVLPLGLNLISKSYWVRWFPSFILGMANPLLGYSLEGRPLMLALFFGLIYFIFFLDYIWHERNYSWLIVIQLLFLNTTGLQPQLFIFFSIVYFSIPLMLEKRNRIAIKIFLSGVMSSLIHLPILYGLVLFTEETNQFNNDFFQNALNLLSFDRLSRIGSIYREDEWFLMYLGIFFLFLGGHYLIKKQRREMSLYLFPFVYLIGYFVIYSTFISWNFSIRYTYCFYGAFAFVISCSLRALNERFPKNINRAFYVLLVGYIIVGTYQNLKKPLRESIENGQRPQWAALYNHLNDNVTEKDNVLRISLVELGSWRGNYYVGDLFHASSKTYQRLLRLEEVETWDYSAFIYYDDRVDYLEESGDLYVIVAPFFMLEKFRDLKTEEVEEVHHYNLLDLYKIKKKDNLYLTTKDYFKSIIKKYPLHESTMPIYETLLFLEYKYAETSEFFKELLEDYKAVRVKRLKTLEGIIIKKDGEHEKRIKLFKELLKKKWK